MKQLNLNPVIKHLLNRSLTWRVWSALYRFPTSHPLFQRAININLPRVSRTYQLYTTVIVIFGLINILIQLVRDWGTLLLLAMLVLSSGMMQAAHAATQVAYQISQQREAGFYDLIGLTPDGSFSAGVSAAARHIRFNPLYLGLSQTAFIAQTTLIFLAFPMALVMPGLHAGGGFIGSAATLNGMFAILTVMTWVLMLRLEYMRAVVAGALLGMLVPVLVKERASVRPVAVLASVGLQVLVGGTALGAVILTSSGFGRLDTVTFGLTLVLLIGLVALGEIVNRRLWSWVKVELNTDDHELQTLQLLSGWVFTM